MLDNLKYLKVMAPRDRWFIIGVGLLGHVLFGGVVMAGIFHGSGLGAWSLPLAAFSVLFSLPWALAYSLSRLSHATRRQLDERLQ